MQNGGASSVDDDAPLFVNKDEGSLVGMRTLKNVTLFSLGVAILAISGCNDASPAQDEQNQGLEKKAATPASVISPVNPKIEPSESIAIVNGVPIRRSDYDRWVVLRARAYCDVNGLDFQKRSEKLDGYIWTTRGAALTDLIRRELIRQECEKKPVTVSSNVLVATQRRFMKHMRRPKVSFDVYVETLPQNEGEELAKQVYCDARDEVFLKNWATNDISSVSALEVSNRIAFVQNYNKGVEERNADSKKRAAAAKAEILAGASFCQVATNRADIFIDQAEFWDIVEIGDFEPEEDIFKFLASAKKGDISDPLDFDDGIGLVGVLNKEKEVQDDGVVSEQFTLVRCMFNGYDPIEESEDFETVRRSLLEEKVEKARQALVAELFKSAKIEYPFGKKLFLKKNAKGVNKARKKQNPQKKNEKKKPVRVLPPLKAKPASAKGSGPSTSAAPAAGM